MQDSLQETRVLLYLDLVMNVVGMYVWALWICTRTWSEVRVSFVLQKNIIEIVKHNIWNGSAQRSSFMRIT